MNIMELESQLPISDDTTLRAELQERMCAHYHGRVGVSPLLSRRVVRALLVQSLKSARKLIDATNCDNCCARETAVVDTLEYVARLLLAIPPDAPSPLEGENSPADEGEK